MDVNPFYNHMQDRYEMDLQTRWAPYVMFIIFMILLLVGILYAGYTTEK